MASLKRIKRELAKLQDDDLKEVLEFLTDDEEVEEDVDVIEEEQKEQKEETKQEPVVDNQVIQLSKTDLEELLKSVTSGLVSKKELEEVKQTVDKTVKKAKPFGEQQKNPKEDKKEELNISDYLAKVNSQFV